MGQRRNAREIVPLERRCSPNLWNDTSRHSLLYAAGRFLRFPCYFVMKIAQPLGPLQREKKRGPTAGWIPNEISYLMTKKRNPSRFNVPSSASPLYLLFNEEGSLAKLIDGRIS